MTRKERIFVVLIATGITALVLLGIWTLRTPQIEPKLPETIIDPVPENPDEENPVPEEYVPANNGGTQPETINPLANPAENGGIEGVVRNEKGAPIHNATITILQMREALRYYFTSEEGRYAFGGIAGGIYSVKAEREGYATSTRNNVQVLDDQVTRNVNFELAAGGAFKGTVVNDKDEPIRGAKVTLYSSSPVDPVRGFERSFRTVTNGDGEFNIENVAPGEYRAIAQEDSHIQSERVPMNIDSRRPAVYNFVLKFGGSIAGSVTDIEGNPVSDAQVWLSSDDNTLVLARGARTDEDGRYALKGLKSGRVNIQVQSPAYIKGVRQGVEVYEGRPTEDVNFTLDAGKALRGIVMNAAGEPVEKATISGNDKESYKTVRSEKDGSFLLQGFSKDMISISVRASGYVLFVHRDIQAGTEDFKVILSRGGSVEGRAISDEPLGSFVVILYSVPGKGEKARPVKQKISSDSKGNFKVEDIPPGSYNLEVHSKDYIQVKSEAVDVRENSTISGVQILMQLRTARR